MSRMFLPVLGLLTLSVSGIASELLFHVDIVLRPREGRRVIDDIEFINRTLSQLNGINVIFARKTFDNRNILLVLDVDEICQWSTFTSDMSEQGYELNVSPLQNCTETADEFGVNVSYHPLDEIQAIDVLDLVVLQFYDKGMTTDEYFTSVKKHFERDRMIIQEGCKSVCFRKTGELPMTVYYWVHATSSEFKRFNKEIRNEAKVSATMDLVQYFDVYTDKC